MNEYEKIIKQVVSATFCNRLTEEEACEILYSLYRIISNQTISAYPSSPYIPPVTYTDTYTDAPGSLPESLLKQATTLPYGKNKNKV